VWDKEELTCVAGASEVDGDLSPDAAGRSDNEGDFFFGGLHGADCVKCRIWSGGCATMSVM
jgi:hypothetical protein